MRPSTLFAISAAALLAATAAAAADNTPWSGWHVGVNLGGAWGDTSRSMAATPGSGTVVIPPEDAAQVGQVGGFSGSPGGVTFGGEGGYDWLFPQGGKANPDHLLVGLETDIDYTDLRQSRYSVFQSVLSADPTNPSPAPGSVAITQKTQNSWLWTLRPRFGYNTGSWLIYATGGLALGGVELQSDYSDNISPGHFLSLRQNSTEVGWTAGAGVGYAMASNWALKAEYLYTDLGSISQAGALQDGYGSIVARTGVRTNIMRIGLDYRF